MIFPRASEANDEQPDGDRLGPVVRQRAAAALAAPELVVDYYRIGYRLSWPLPLDRRPDGFPAEVPGIPRYPWTTWVGWQLEERWAALDNAGEHGLLIRELEALAGWTDFVADD